MLLLLALALAALALRSAKPKQATEPPVTRPSDDAAAPEPAKQRLLGERKLAGVVLDDQQKPLSDALVRVSSLDDPEALPWEAATDRDGRFAFDALVAHALSVEVTREGHDGSEHMLRADDSSELTFVLPRQGELMVVVRDAPGRSVEGALVTLTGPGLWPAAERSASHAGEALFGKLAFGEYRARARHGSRVALPSAKVRVVPGQRTQLELTMREGAELRALVVDASSGAPLAAAKLALFDPTPGISPVLAESDEQGRVHMTGLLPAALRIEVTHEGHAPRSLDVTLPSTAPVRIELAGEASIAGQVVDEQGRPIEGALISISTREGLPVQLGSSNSSPLRAGELGVTRGPVPKVPITYSAEPALGTLATQSDARGAFRIAGLTPAPVLVSAARSGYATHALPVSDLKPHGEHRDLKLVLRAAGRVEGTIRDARGHPVASVYVSARSQGAEHSAISDAAGNFALLDVLGDVQVLAEPQGHGSLSCRVQVAPGARERCDMTVGAALFELPVRVLDEFQFGLEGVLVSVGAEKGRSYTQVTRRDGSAVLRDLPEPPYRVEAALRGYVSATLDVSEPEKEVRLQLVRAATLAGLVTDSLGRPVPGAIVSTDEGDATAETDIEGNFVMTGVTPGALYVWAAHQSVGEARSNEVRARAGQTLESLRIVLPGRYLPGDRSEAPRGATSVSTDERSDARPRRVKPADYELELQGDRIVFVDVQGSGAAARAGLRSGDVLVSVDGEPVRTAAQGRGMLRDPPGLAANLRVTRAGAQLRIRYKRPSL